MDIKEYRYIYTVAKEGSISKAAEKLYIAQPSLSLYIKNLQERIGVQLFHYSGGVLRLTEEGKLYVRRAEQILETDRSLMEELEDMRNLRTGIVHLGIANTRSRYILPKLLKRLHEKYPGLEIRVEEAISSQLEELAYERRVDFIIANRPFRRHELEYRKIGDEEAILVVPESIAQKLHPQEREGYKYPWLSVEDIQDLPFTVLTHGQRLGQAAESLFLSMTKRPRIILETQSADTAVSMAEQGLSVCLLYDSYRIFQKTKGLCMFNVGDIRIPHQLVIAYAKEEELSAAAAAVIGESALYLNEIFSLGRSDA